ncbi:MAG TPA: nucleoside deaminase [Burkholderiales bacterium]|nr:nucleoside deaminase [Burkholderiales bacterium]
MATSTPNRARRNALARAVVGAVLLVGHRLGLSTERSDAPSKPEQRWFEAAASMKRLAESWGDQPYGAVLVADGAIIGEGPSRVVKRGDPTAHAEREAIRDAQRRLGRTSLVGSVLYSTSRPCRQCEVAAAEARVARMIYGAELNDAGQPRP